MVELFDLLVMYESNDLNKTARRLTIHQFNLIMATHLLHSVRITVMIYRRSCIQSGNRNTKHVMHVSQQTSSNDSDIETFVDVAYSMNFELHINCKNVSSNN
jgi:hypothetical protein